MIDIVSQIISRGADKAQCHIAQTEKQEINVENSRITLMRTAFNTGITLSAIVGGRRGTTTINQCDEASIEKACDAVLEMANASQEDSANDIAEFEDGSVSYSDGPLKVDTEKLYDRLNELLELVGRKYPGIKLDGQCMFQYSHSLWTNSNGVNFDVEDGRYAVNFMFNASENGIAASFNYTGAVSRDLDTPFIESGGLGMLIEQNIEELKAQALKDKFVGDIIVTPICLADFLGLYVNTFLSDTPLVSGTSPLKDKLEQRVAGENITIMSNPRDRDVCGYAITGDGFRAKDMTIIENGILKSFCLSQYGAKRVKLPRSNNIGDLAQMSAGDTPLEELIKTVKRGLLVGRFSGGNPNENGDFSGVAKNSFYIEDGKIVKPVLETMISANLREMFNNVKGISSETISSGEWKNPWVLFAGIAISGS